MSASHSELSSKQTTRHPLVREVWNKGNRDTIAQLFARWRHLMATKFRGPAG
jgi:hypothetical protein